MANISKRIIHRTLSIRISLMVVFAVSILLMTALCLVLGYSYRVIKKDAELNANETLEYTIQHIDNVLLSVEQTAGNLYWDILAHLDSPEQMFTYTRRLIESNPYIIGCAIAMKPDYYKEKGYGRLFMAYLYRSTDAKGDTTIVQSDTFANEPYDRQEWYTRPMETGLPCWIDPIKDADKENEAITTFSLPMYNKEGKVVGVLGVDVSTVLLSNIVMSAKPTPNSFAIMIDSSGSLIVYPDKNLLFHQERTQQEYLRADTTVKETGMAMMAGQSGSRYIHLNEGDCYVFYKPFRRAAAPWRVQQDLKWSAGVIFPVDDIMGDFYRIRSLVVTLGIVGLVLLLILCWAILHRQLLPLRLLTLSAYRITKGQYDKTIPKSDSRDEVGSLQNHFREMQLSLSEHIRELQQLTDTLNERGKGLEAAYKKSKEAERVKTSFLHNMTNQMLPPVQSIVNSVDSLCAHYKEMDTETAAGHDKEIQKQSKIITQLLDQLLKASQE